MYLRYFGSLDPECPEVMKYYEENLNGPMAAANGLGEEEFNKIEEELDEIAESFAREHATECICCHVGRGD